jgi:hypothetical protein
MHVPSLSEADAVGARANELLSRPGFHGKVLAVVSGAVYLTSFDGEILWLGKSRLPKHPRAILGPFELGAFRAGIAFRSDGTRLCTEGHTCLEWGDALVWHPALTILTQAVPRARVNMRVTQLMDWVRASNASVASTSDPFDVAAVGPKREIARACRDRDLPRVLELGRALIGLGPGLTPSGDDFLGGLLFVAQHLHAAYPEAFDWKQQSIDDWLDWARPRTNPISYAILCDHAGGKSVEPLHNLVAALLQSKPLNEMILAVQALLAIGSTSGREILSGALTGMLFIASTSRKRAPTLFPRLVCGVQGRKPLTGARGCPPKPLFFPPLPRLRIVDPAVGSVGRGGPRG